MGIGSFLFGSKDKFKQLSNLTPEQQRGLSKIFEQMGLMGGEGGNYQQSQDYLSKMISGDPESYARWAAPYQTQFNEQTIPRLAERFAGMGGGLGGGALSSSGFGQALGGAATQFQSNLSGLYAQLQQQAAQQAMGQYNNLAQLGLGTRAFENIYQPGNTGILGGALSGLAGGFGQGIGQGVGNRMGNWFSSSGAPRQSESIYDTYGPNAGNGSYNPYTGYQG